MLVCYKEHALVFFCERMWAGASSWAVAPDGSLPTSHKVRQPRGLMPSGLGSLLQPAAPHVLSGAWALPSAPVQTFPAAHTLACPGATRGLPVGAARADASPSPLKTRDETPPSLPFQNVFLCPFQMFVNLFNGLSHHSGISPQGLGASYLNCDLQGRCLPDTRFLGGGGRGEWAERVTDSNCRVSLLQRVWFPSAFAVSGFSSGRAVRPVPV